MAHFPNIKIPNVDTGKLDNVRYIKKMISTLMSLEESLRYMFGNLDDDNMTSQFIKDLTVGNILITNGENSIVGNPSTGFRMYKGLKEILSFDINTGEAKFGGDVIGGNIQSANYSIDEVGNVLAGMKINLTDGTINTVGFNYADGKLQVVDGEFTGDITGSTFKSMFLGPNGQYIALQMDYSDFIADKRTVDTDGIEHKVEGGKYGWQGLYFRRYDEFLRNSGFTCEEIFLRNVGGNLFEVNGYYMRYKDNDVLTTGSQLGVNGTFVSADGKTVTVTNGLITNIV